MEFEYTFSENALAAIEMAAKIGQGHVSTGPLLYAVLRIGNGAVRLDRAVQVTASAVLTTMQDDLAQNYPMISELVSVSETETEDED